MFGRIDLNSTYIFTVDNLTLRSPFHVDDIIIFLSSYCSRSPHLIRELSHFLIKNIIVISPSSFTLRRLQMKKSFYVVCDLRSRVLEPNFQFWSDTPSY